MLRRAVSRPATTSDTEPRRASQHGMSHQGFASVHVEGVARAHGGEMAASVEDVGAER